jgi:hypothetical protein
MEPEKGDSKKRESARARRERAERERERELGTTLHTGGSCLLIFSTAMLTLSNHRDADSEKTPPQASSVSAPCGEEVRAIAVNIWHL